MALQKKIVLCNGKPISADPATLEVLLDGYAKDRDHVFFQGQELTPFTHWNLSSTEETKIKIEPVDPSTFVVLTNGYAKDKNHVFLENFLIEGADPASFQVLKVMYPSSEQQLLTPFARDQKHVYRYHHLQEGLDPTTFIPLTEELGMDQKGVYSHFYSGWRPIPVHQQSWVCLDEYYSVDRVHVYYRAKPIEGVDPQSFRVLGQGIGGNEQVIVVQGKIWQAIGIQNIQLLSKGYLSDGKAIYWIDALLTPHAKLEVDPKNFVALADDFGSDGNHVFYANIKIPQANPYQFTTLGHHFAKDEQTVYYENEPIKGAHPQSFRLFPQSTYTGYAIDQNQAYFRQQIWSEHCDWVQIEPIPQVDVTTFRVLDDRVAFDQNQIYSEGQVVSFMDRSSFESLGYGYYRDQNKVCFGPSHVIASANPKTLMVYDSSYATVELQE